MKIETIDKRGTEELPFGYIYFSDGSRTGFASAYGPTAGEILWELTGSDSEHWKPISVAHQKLALQHLRTHGAKVPE